MSTIQLELDDDLLALLGAQEQPLEASAREFIVLELYRRGQISKGKAAEFLGMSYLDFVRFASRLGIPYFNLTPEDLSEDLAEIKRQWPESSSATPAP